MLRVRGTSMIDAGILDGDFIVARSQNWADNGDIVVAGIPGDEATVKTYRHEPGHTVLVPANAELEPMVFEPGEVSVFGRVVTVMRKL
jgi:repressor LexA